MDLLSEYSREQLITALQNEHDYLIHDDFDPEEDMSSEEHLQWIKSLSLDDLKIETLESIDIGNMFKEGEKKGYCEGLYAEMDLIMRNYVALIICTTEIKSLISPSLLCH